MKSSISRPAAWLFTAKGNPDEVVVWSPLLQQGQTA
jgi:hypothetical protein